jgi:hypothetical protein
MHAKLLVGSALFTRTFAAIVTPSASTADATITPGPQIELLRKQNDDRFMGWVSYEGIGWSSERCVAGATYYQTDNHWRCCAATVAGCDIPQACVNGNLIYSISSTALTIPWCVLLQAALEGLVTNDTIVHPPTMIQQKPPSLSATLLSYMRTSRTQVLRRTSTAVSVALTGRTTGYSLKERRPHLASNSGVFTIPLHTDCLQDLPQLVLLPL